jgi:hypothetical protein
VSTEWFVEDDHKRKQLMLEGPLSKRVAGQMKGAMQRKWKPHQAQQIGSRSMLMVLSLTDRSQRGRVVFQKRPLFDASNAEEVESQRECIKLVAEWIGGKNS